MAKAFDDDDAPTLFEVGAQPDTDRRSAPPSRGRGQRPATGTSARDGEPTAGPGAPAFGSVAANASDRGAAPAGAAPGGLKAPLAARMRPRALDEFVGQQELLAPGSALRRAIETGHPHSMILHGPPGTGKTTLARIVASASGYAFEEESAVEAGRAEVRAVIERARTRRRGVAGGPGMGTVFFLDEIHRFNKAQQDALLPAVESGLVVLIDATTENPYFEVNQALLSRTRVYELTALSAQDVRTLLQRAVDRGECGEPALIDSEALDYAAQWVEGDARAALSGLELACETVSRSGARGGEAADAGAKAPSGSPGAAASSEGPAPSAAAAAPGRVTVDVMADALQARTVSYDRQADNHYDTISAWIKSTRGSDPDASLYYLAVMLEGGEDPRFIARRMVILASEDIGNADPQAIQVATAAAAAVDRVGVPECEFPLAQAAIYLSLAPKSDGAKRAIHAVRAFVREHGAASPPPYLRSSGRNDGNYDYPHDHPNHLAPQELLPASVATALRSSGSEAAGGVETAGAGDTRAPAHFYEPDDAEAVLRERLAEIRRGRGAGND